MVSSHEQPHFANYTDDPLDRQMERLVDQGVATPYGAAAHVLDYDPQRDTDVARDPRAAAAAKSRRHYSRRGGRSYPEPSDSELDPNWQHSEFTPVSEGQVLTNRIGVSVIQGVLMGLRHQAEAEAEAAHAAHLEEVRARADEELRRQQ